MDKKRIIILGSIVLIILMILGFTVLLIKSSKKAPPQPNTRIVPSADNSDVLSVTQTTPSDKATNIGVSEDIVVTFNKSLTDAQKENVSVDSQPTTSGTVSWSPDNTSLIYTHEVPFDSKALYRFTVTTSTLQHPFSFTTTGAENVTEEEAQKIQTAADKDFADTWNTIDTNYDWYRDLPLDDPDDKYFVYFDVDKKIFIAKVYADPTELNAIQETVQLRLQGLGVNLQQYKIEWLLQ